ncbi:MAG TPA: DUF3592 domain-containing protein [Allosphingosinicella sp.]|nr:DUF3592 domain-containing protein [Allosphingosinicella sp.]
MKTWLKVVLIFAAIGAAITAMLWMDSRRKATMTAEGQAVVTGALLHEDDESSSLDETRISYRFETGGSAFEGLSSVPGDRVSDWPAGRTARVCYNPEDPTVSEIRDSGRPCG